MKKNQMISTLLDKPLWQLNGHEFVVLLENSLNKLEGLCNQGSKKRYVYGLDGLKDLLGVSKSSAERIKKSGALDLAIYQNNRTIVIDADMALELFAKKKAEKKGEQEEADTSVHKDFLSETEQKCELKEKGFDNA